MQFAAVTTPSPLTTSLRQSMQRKHAKGTRIALVIPKPITHSVMKHGRKGERGAPEMSFSTAVAVRAATPHVPFHIELSTLRRKLNPYNVGDVSSTFLPVLRARLAKLEVRASIIAAHRRTKLGTAIISAMAVKPVMTLSADEIRRAEIAAEICAAGGFVGPRGPRKTEIAPMVKRARRPRGAAKAKVSWLDVVETKTV